MTKNILTTLTVAIALIIAGPAFAQLGHTHGPEQHHDSNAGADKPLPPQPAPPAAQPDLATPDTGLPNVYETQGVVKAIDVAGPAITLDHGAIPALRWGPMVMSFPVEDVSLLEGIKVGDTVRFDLQVQPDGRTYSIIDLEVQ
jgi:Cu(I)/Ag(I) efflux system membrane fusion protein